MVAPKLVCSASTRSYARYLAETVRPLDELVTALVPSLLRSLAEQLNVFRVMRHGTHEKQLSNVFAWLLCEDATHALRDAFQRLFVERVQRALPAELKLPTAGYRVLQEVDTSGHEALDKDIADIVLASPKANIVVEKLRVVRRSRPRLSRVLGARRGR